MTMKRKAIETDIQLLETMLANRKHELFEYIKDHPTKKWEPRGGKYFISGCGVVSELEPSQSSAAFGAEFETREAAEKAAKAYRAYHRLYKLAEELNEGWEPDWEDETQRKYLIRRLRGDYQITSFSSLDTVGTIYFKDEAAALKALSILEAEG